MSASAPATTVACTNDAEVLDGVLGALDTHEFVFGRLVSLADALGCASALPSLESVATDWLVFASSSGITPNAGADGPENAEKPGIAAVPENAIAVDDAL